jgi:chemotaxis protein CheZ
MSPMPQASGNPVSGIVPPLAVPTNAHVAMCFDRVFDELASIRVGIEGLTLSGSVPAPVDDGLWNGIAAIHEAITRTREEILTLHAKGVKNDQIFRATDELDAVVITTESATETILTSAEFIDATAGELMRDLDGVQGEKVAAIQEQTVRIFEACNFQDLSGQRIRKVVDLLQFIETRIASMIAIWRGVGEFDEAPETELEPTDEDLLNGPPLDGDAGIVSQDDIDSLFK